MSHHDEFLAVLGAPAPAELHGDGWALTPTSLRATIDGAVRTLELDRRFEVAVGRDPASGDTVVHVFQSEPGGRVRVEVWLRAQGQAWADVELPPQQAPEHALAVDDGDELALLRGLCWALAASGQPLRLFAPGAFQRQTHIENGADVVFDPPIGDGSLLVVEWADDREERVRIRGSGIADAAWQARKRAHAGFVVAVVGAVFFFLTVIKTSPGAYKLAIVLALAVFGGLVCGLYFSLERARLKRALADVGADDMEVLGERVARAELCALHVDVAGCAVHRLERDARHVTIVEAKLVEHVRELCEVLRQTWRVPVTRRVELIDGLEDAVAPDVWFHAAAAVAAEPPAQSALPAIDYRPSIDVALGADVEIVGLGEMHLSRDRLWLETGAAAARHEVGRFALREYMGTVRLTVARERPELVLGQRDAIVAVALLEAWLADEPDRVEAAQLRTARAAGTRGIVRLSWSGGRHGVVWITRYAAWVEGRFATGDGTWPALSRRGDALVVGETRLDGVGESDADAAVEVYGRMRAAFAG